MRRLLLPILLLLCFAAWLTWPRQEELPPLPPGARADRILVEKAGHRMTLFQDGQVLRVYAVALGRGGPGPKQREGDGKVPEGEYRIVGRNPRSSHYLSLRISYPEPRDVAEAAARNEPPGSDIMIHGLRNWLGWVGPVHRWFDRTLGCVAVTNPEMQEIWGLVPDGTPIDIRA